MEEVVEIPGQAFLLKTLSSKLILQPEKRILMLISVGQDYHEGDFMDATVDLLEQQISLCRDIVLDEAMWRDRGVDVGLAKGRWILRVVCADSLQIRNFIEQRYRAALLAELGALDDNTENEELRQAIILSLLGEWCELGSNYQKKAMIAYERCRKAGQQVSEDGSTVKQVIEVDVQVTTGHELFGETPEIGMIIELAGQQINQSTVTHYGFWEAYQCLRYAYDGNIDALMQLANKKDEAFRNKLNTICHEVYKAVNTKGYGHMTRDKTRSEAFRSLLRPKELSQYFPKGKLDTTFKLPDHLRDYILVEFAYLAHCLALGCGFPENLNRNSPIYIMYPHPASFPAMREIQNLFEIIFAGKKVCDVDYLGFGVTNKVKNSYDEYSIGVSHHKIDLFEKVQRENKDYLINVLRGALQPMIKKTGNRDEFNLPLKDETFVRRDSVRKNIETIFAAPPTKETQVAVVFLQGLGGMGKTQIALDCCHFPVHDYNLVIWIDGSLKSIDTLYEQLAMDLFQYKIGQSVDESIRKVRKYLTEHPGWFLVLDDIAEDVLRHELELEKSPNKTSFFKGKLDKKVFSSVIPDSGGHLMIISRLEGWQGEGVINVDAMELEGAIEVLKKRLGERFNLADAELVRLAELLYRYPLALSHAAAWILLSYDEAKQSPEQAIAHYIELYEKTPSKILDVKKDQQGAKKDRAHYHDSAVRTLKMLVERIQPVHEKEVTLARELLSMMSFINGELIPQNFIEKWTEKSRSKDLSKLMIELEKLLKTFLIVRSTQETFRMHKVVQDILRDWMVDNPTKQNHEVFIDDEWYQQLMQLVFDFAHQKNLLNFMETNQYAWKSTVALLIKNYHAKKMPTVENHLKLLSFPYLKLLAYDFTEETFDKSIASLLSIEKILYFLFSFEIAEKNISRHNKFTDGVILGLNSLKLCRIEDFDYEEMEDVNQSTINMNFFDLLNSLEQNQIDEKNLQDIFYSYLIKIPRICDNFIEDSKNLTYLLELLDTLHKVLSFWQFSHDFIRDQLLFLVLSIFQHIKLPQHLYGIISAYSTDFMMSTPLPALQVRKSIFAIKRLMNYFDSIKVENVTFKSMLLYSLGSLYSRLGMRDEIFRVITENESLRSKNPENKPIIEAGLGLVKMFLSTDIVHGLTQHEDVDIDDDLSNFEKDLMECFIGIEGCCDQPGFLQLVDCVKEIKSFCNNILQSDDAPKKVTTRVPSIRYVMQFLMILNNKKVNDYLIEQLLPMYGDKLLSIEGLKSLVYTTFANEDFVSCGLFIYFIQFYFNENSDQFVPLLHLFLTSYREMSVNTAHKGIYLDAIAHLLETGMNINIEIEGIKAIDIIKGDEEMTKLLLKYLSKKLQKEEFVENTNRLNFSL